MRSPALRSHDWLKGRDLHRWLHKRQRDLERILGAFVLDCNLKLIGHMHEFASEGARKRCQHRHLVCVDGLMLPLRVFVLCGNLKVKLAFDFSFGSDAIHLDRHELLLLNGRALVISLSVRFANKTEFEVLDGTFARTVITGEAPTDHLSRVELILLQRYF